MESIPATISSNTPQVAPQLIANAPTAPVRQAVVDISVSPEGDSITLNNTEYELRLINTQQRQALISASHFLANLPSSPATPHQPAQLLALGEPLLINLPKTILALAQQNNITQEQLFLLAGRAQGYPLPNVTLTHNSLHFANGTVVAQDPGTRISSGEYQANIRMIQDRIMLLLTPMLGKLDILIGPAKASTQALNLTNTPAQMVLAKTELAQIYRHFFKQLNGLAPTSELPQALKFTILPTPSAADGDEQGLNPMRDPTLAAKLTAKLDAQPLTAVNLKSSHTPSGNAAYPLATMSPSAASNAIANNLEAELGIPLQGPKEENKAALAGLNSTNLALAQPYSADQGSNKAAALYTTVTEVLQKAFNKAGALPNAQQSASFHINLAAELLKQLPHLSPQPLSQLTDPQSLKDDILGLATLNLASPLQPSSLLMNASAITSLFQLLLGFKAASTHQAISQRLANYLEQLQRKIGLSANQLSQMSKAGGLESMGQLASNLQLYQQASADNGNLTWFFALPYSMDQRHEQLEGKFQPEDGTDDPQKLPGWHLQLKFNLTQGPLLISARCHQQTLDIEFKGNNQQLLSRVETFLTPLGQKLG
ncbi:MAG: flagellar hook-length control protein FliK, partial [Shewanella sp.]